MTYSVHLADAFIADLHEQTEYWRGEGVPPGTIEAWFAKMLAVIDQLAEMPRMFPVDEYQTGTTGVETRKIVVGNHLVFYQIDDHNQRVNVVAFMHAAARHD